MPGCQDLSEEAEKLSSGKELRKERYIMRQMKDSGIEWIGLIPAGWKRTKLLNLLRQSICDGPHETPTLVADGIPFISVDSLNSSERVDIEKCKKFISEEDYHRYKVKANIEENDILFTKAATIGKTAIVGKETFMVWSPIAIIKTDSSIAVNKYVYHLLNCHDLIKYISLLGSYNTQINVGMRELEQAIVPLPPLMEQQRIADYLDQRCAEIDAVIERTKATIEEYKKLRQAIITDAVTKGVRMKRTMKNSENIWYGDIPVDWDIRKLKYMFRIIKDIAGREGYTVLSITQRGIRPKNIASNEGQLAENYSNYQLVEPGDFAMNHMDLLTGWVDISQYSGVTSPDYRVFNLLDPKHNCSKYYLYLMQMCYTNRIFYGLGQGVSGMGRWRLQADKFLNFTIPVPPCEEQFEIAEYLDKRCAEMDTLIAKKTALLAELEAYKKSVIYEYVTGKKEVTAVKLSPEAVDPDDVEMLEDLIMAAINEAMKQAEEASNAAMSKMTGGLGGFPF